jgi:SAM-dependent methyltransferase
MNNFFEYFTYLRKRSVAGKLYRGYWLYPKLVKYLPMPSLDIGCGIGDMVKFNKGMVGVDINPLTVKFCQESGLEVMQMQPNKLPFEDVIFHSILLDNVIEHIESPILLLEEIRRVAKHDGILIIGIPGEKGYNSDSDHKTYYTEENLIRKITPLGFIHQKTIHAPLKIKLLNKKMRQYCIYCVFRIKKPA